MGWLTPYIVGFFYIINFGLPQDDIDRQFAIGKTLFALDTDEKLKYRADLESGSYNGYRPKGVQEIFPGMMDNFEMYNIFKFSRWPSMDKAELSFSDMTKSPS